MSTIIAKYMNTILKDGRKMPIVPLIEPIRDLMQTRFYEGQNVDKKLDKPMTNLVEKQLNI